MIRVPSNQSRPMSEWFVFHFKLDFDFVLHWKGILNMLCYVMSRKFLYILCIKISTFVEYTMNIEGTIVRTGIEWKQALLIYCLFK